MSDSVADRQPVNKANVMFLNDPKTGERVDQHDYPLVSTAIRGLPAPFDACSANWTTRRVNHFLFRHVDRNQPCPCDSGKRYKDCCMREIGVLQRHVEIRFANP